MKSLTVLELLPRWATVPNDCYPIAATDDLIRMGYLVWADNCFFQWLMFGWSA